MLRYHRMDLLTVLAFSELSWNKIFFCKRFALKQVNVSENSSDEISACYQILPDLEDKRIGFTRDNGMVGGGRMQ